jgi:hypothetical protein
MIVTLCWKKLTCSCIECLVTLRERDFNDQLYVMQHNWEWRRACSFVSAGHCFEKYSVSPSPLHFGSLQKSMGPLHLHYHLNILRVYHISWLQGKKSLVLALGVEMEKWGGVCRWDWESTVKFKLRMSSPWIWCHVALVRTDVSEEYVSSMIRVERTT